MTGRKGDETVADVSVYVDPICIRPSATNQAVGQPKVETKRYPMPQTQNREPRLEGKPPTTVPRALTNQTIGRSKDLRLTCLKFS